MHRVITDYDYRKMFCAIARKMGLRFARQHMAALRVTVHG